MPEVVITVFENQKFFLRGIFFSVLLWMVNLIIIFLLLMSVDAGVSAAQIISYWSSSMLTGMLPVTISSLGTIDTAFIYALGESLNNTKLLTATFLYSVIVYWILTALSFIVLTFSKTFNLRNS